MRVHLSVCSLLVCAFLGYLAGADPIRTQKPKNIEENVIEDHIDTIVQEPQAPDRSLFLSELAVFQKGLWMENDDGKLVELTLNEAADGNESEDETSNKINDSVLFRLYTRRNPVDHQPLWLNDRDALASSNFRADKPTHFVTHGWVNSGKSPACSLIRDAYLEHADLNVIVVDWSKITMRPYNWAARRVMMVGKHVAKMIDFLQLHANLDTNKTTLAGHSLGAHVMGLAGYYSNGTINYVVGLDPALPLFVFAGPGSRISVHDANHVQIIHTNAGLLGYLDAIGHTDFYPNGGSRQHGCVVDVGGACSHARSYRFFAESITTPKGFYGKSCESFLQYKFGLCKSKLVALMGGTLIDLDHNGKYFLSTRSISPFAEGR